MRLVLLAILSVVLIAPKAEAARRDDDRSRTTSQAQSGNKGAKATPRRDTPASATAARSTATPARSAATSTRRAAAAPSRSAARTQAASRTRTTSRTAGRQQPTRAPTTYAGAVRTQRTGLVVRGASAATVSRDSANCTRRNGRTVCGARRDGVAGWQAGLPQVNMAQSECPAGTFATLARGHENVVRCMPL